MPKRFIGVVSACLSAALLAACGGGSRGLFSSAPQFIVPSASGLVLLPGASANLYALTDYGVTVYAPGSGMMLRTISQGVNAPSAMAFGP